MRLPGDGPGSGIVIDLIIGALVVLLVCYLLAVAATVVWMAAPVWIVGLVLAILAPLLHLGMLVGSVREGDGIHRLGRLTETASRVEFEIDAAKASRWWSPALVGALAVLGYAVGAGVAFHAMGGASWISPELHGLPHQLIYPAVVAPVWLVRYVYRPIHNHGVARLETAVRQRVDALATAGSTPTRPGSGSKADLDRARAVAAQFREIERYWGGTGMGPRIAELEQLVRLVERDPSAAHKLPRAASALEQGGRALLQITQRHRAYREWVRENEPVVMSSGYQSWTEQLACIEAAIDSPSLTDEVRRGQFPKAMQRLEEIAKLLGLLSFMMEADRSSARRPDYRGPKAGAQQKQERPRAERQPSEPPNEPRKERERTGQGQERPRDNRAASNTKSHDLAWAFGVLHLPESATFDEARKAHRHLVKFFHPDAGNVSDDLAMKEINEAWDLVQAHLERR